MNSTNQEAKLKTLPGPWSLGEMTGNWRDIDLPDHGGVMRIVWKMEGDEGRNDALEAQAHAVVAALNAAFSEPPAGPQAQLGTVYAELPVPNYPKSGGFPGSFAEVQMLDFADRTHALRMRQAAPKAAPGEQSAVSAEWLEQAYREGWAACRDAETIGEEAEDWAFGNSTANSRMIDAQQAAPQQEAQEPIGWTTGITWRPNSRLQSEQVIKITRDAQPNYGYTTPIYTAPQPTPDGGSCADGNTPGLMPADAELLAHIKKAVPGLTRVNTALMVAKAVLEKFGSRRVASEVK